MIFYMLQNKQSINLNLGSLDMPHFMTFLQEFTTVFNKFNAQQDDIAYSFIINCIFQRDNYVFAQLCSDQQSKNKAL
ncbi:unnamed protein product (macronuclear) [Paramecium tetraurelia]|uniref:Uncharacterized protein n=1 Tax=Paramecium tetraurelia TaxID=5888 RepID=A0EG80_PARTE|nr:uncharacterized protein GSPATT00026645001 [Paramecium tetraurelia]CAK94321.1 unnamed protein product [Paramecium tetraurelia]|eukprot:XP_001461694.1 hypothetical protein (macronuclear) [Paramecium tetraurelia strain d4-2]